MTNSMGGFTVAVPACGTGSITLYAQYYGWPPPEPITANQATLAGASTMFSGSNTCTGKVQNEYCTTFPVYNYYWTPNVTAISSQIGLLVLSYGNITVAAIVVAIGLAVFVAFAISRHPKRASHSRKSPKS